MDQTIQDCCEKVQRLLHQTQRPLYLAMQLAIEAEQHELAKLFQNQAEVLLAMASTFIMLSRIQDTQEVRHS